VINLQLTRFDIRAYLYGVSSYVFFLFKQSPQFARQTLVNATTSRALFNISQFASAVDLGRPLAGTFMLVAPAPA
jgi:hypothetical protein